MNRLKFPANYFGRDLGDYFSHGANRLILYPLIFSFFLLEGLVIWLIYRGPAYYLDHMAFTTMYSLHKAAGKTICLFGADYLAHSLIPSWGAYEKRTVGRQWIIWSLGLATGFLPVRMIARKLVSLYAPDMATYYAANPQASLSIPTVLMILIPCWVAAMLFATVVALSRQRIQQQVNAIMPVKDQNYVKKGSPTLRRGRSPTGGLKLGSDNGHKTIALADITHVTVEDHYCRINYATDNGPKSQMVRLPLKKFAMKLPRENFLKVHRSHVVNLGHVSRLVKKGRDHKIVLRDLNVELPVSRARFKDLPYHLKFMGITDSRRTQCHLKGSL